MVGAAYRLRHGNPSLLTRLVTDTSGCPQTLDGMRPGFPAQQVAYGPFTNAMALGQSRYVSPPARILPPDCDDIPLSQLGAAISLAARMFTGGQRL